MSLEDFRKSLNKTQEEMAEILNMSYSFYQKVESGGRNPSFGFIKKFMDAFPDADTNIFFKNKLHRTCD